MTTPARDTIEVDALRTDRYLQALLEAHDRRAIDTPSDAALDPAVRSAALRLGRELIRVHPSFRFEERLAQRLAGIAAGLQLPAAAGAEGRVIPLAPSTPIAADIDPATGDPAATSEHGLPRPLILGGAMASAAISIAGAAFVAWWRLRPATTPMSRAVRAARQLRLGRVVIDRPGPTRLLD